MMIITTSENIFSMTNLSTVLIVDLIVFIAFIGLLIFREFLYLYLVQHSLNQPDTKLNMGRLIDIEIIPFLYIFCYVLVFRLLNTIY
jgi:hypothetical protein